MTAADPGRSEGGLRIDAPGLLTTVQDLGRGGLASLGVSRSGALDRGALRAANRLLGNDEGAAVLEITLGGFTATALAQLWVAAAGAWGRLRIAGRDVDPYAAHPWPAGEELTWEPFAAGLRGYLAVRGGIDVPLSVGSRSTDLLAGLGPAPLRAGDVVAVGTPAGPIPVGELMPWSPPHDTAIEVPLAAGPRADWFDASAHALLFERTWTVSAQADRVGVRLDGPPLPRIVPGELPSEGMVPGALQVPPDGRPVVLLADGPVTGGYPVIAVVADAALDLFAQVRPGTGIRFRHAR
ncbi:biotin-dependent carboxyltransferase family protein [Microbacterium sp. 1P10UB]|uniref:5-oxoprolinase subunit C family protein n=1 Tax=unclassified Microbacterium TaxID=2609290 RepID=UPI0039A0408D